MMIEKNKHFSNLTVAQLKVCIMAKRKARGETKMPTNRAGLLLLYQEQYFVGPHRRPAPLPSPDASDEEDIELVAAESILVCIRQNFLAVFYFFLPPFNFFRGFYYIPCFFFSIIGLLKVFGKIRNKDNTLE